MPPLVSQFLVENQDLKENQQKKWLQNLDQSDLLDTFDQMIIDKPRSKQKHEDSGSIRYYIHGTKQGSEERTHVLACHLSDEDGITVPSFGEESGQSEISDDEQAVVKLRSKDSSQTYGKSGSKMKKNDIHVNMQRAEEKVYNCDCFLSNKDESFHGNEHIEEETGQLNVLHGEAVVTTPRTKEVSQKHVYYEKKEDIVPQNKPKSDDKKHDFHAYSGFMRHNEEDLSDYHIKEKDLLFPYDGGLYPDEIKMRKDDEHNAMSSNMLIMIIQFITSHARSAFQIFFSSMLVWCHSIFALNMNFDMSKAKMRDFENNTNVSSGLKTVSVVSVVKPKTVSRGVKNIAFGFISVIYVVVILSILFITAFMISFLVVDSLICEPVNLNKELYFDYTKALPEASIDFQESRMYSATENILRGVSLPTRRFHATIFLTLPESDFNRKLGIFQVTAELLSVTDQVLITRSQPCMLRFRSTILHYTRSVLMSIPILTGIWSETQTLALSLLEWEEDGHFHSEGVKVLLAPRAGYSLAKGLPEIYKAEIYVKSEMPWWFSFMGWKWTFCVWIALVIFIGEVVLILGLFRCLLLPDLVSFYTSCAKAIQGKSRFIK